MQQKLILEPEPWGLPLSEVLLPQHLGPLGYTSHAVGKWHLGFFKKVYTPTARGFASHFGFWNGYQDYYSHTVQASVREREREREREVGGSERHYNWWGERRIIFSFEGTVALLEKQMVTFPGSVCLPDKTRTARRPQA
jgi:arylsulfatase A-like enzyme